MITDEQIEYKANKESIRNIVDYAPSSYKAGYIDGAKWAIKEMKKQPLTWKRKDG